MLSTVERVEKVRTRAAKMERRREKRRLSLLSGLCMALAACIGAEACLLLRSGAGSVQGMNGAMLMFEDAGGYVVTGIVCFAAAVAITLLCVRWKKKSEKKRE